MVRIVNVIDIQAPAEEVYRTLRALDAYPTWLTHSLVYRGTAAEASPPGGYVDATTVGRMRGELEEDVPERTLRFHQAKPSGSVDAIIRYELEPRGTGVQVTRIGELTTHGMLRVAQPVLVRMAAGESKRTMAALKRHLEHATA